MHMKICFLCGIFPPDVGGPANYAFQLAKELTKEGIIVKVLCYADAKQGFPEHSFLVERVSRKIPKIIRHFVYFFKTLKLGKDCQTFYVFSAVSAGLPAILANKILKKQIVIRLGGDFLWEKASEKKNFKFGLQEYYGLPKTLKEQFFIILQKKIFKSANKIIFSTNFQKEIYKKHFGLIERNLVVISNPFPDTAKISENFISQNFVQLIFAGRLIKLKNLDFLLEVFTDVLSKTDLALRLKIIGDGGEKENLIKKAKKLGIIDKVIFEGVLPRAKLLLAIQASYLCLLPSLSEISPNFALESLAFKKPILITQETGFADEFNGKMVFLDAKDKKLWVEKIIWFLDKNNYQNFQQQMNQGLVFKTWQDTSKEHLKLFTSL